ncbi:hypothetical protein RJT34_04354 [Clitoria ternatea]|uniref:Uncharacterized protein n=1 Tax=Clitoria ternatea TaxID=43366 RepID=A0AAN9KNC2_CLITE
MNHLTLCLDGLKEDAAAILVCNCSQGLCSEHLTCAGLELYVFYSFLVLIVKDTNPYMFTQKWGLVQLGPGLVPNKYMFLSTVFRSHANFLVYAISNEMDEFFLFLFLFLFMGSECFQTVVIRTYDQVWSRWEIESKIL